MRILREALAAHLAAADNEGLVLAALLQYPARQTGLGFGLDPFLDDVPEFLAKIGSFVELRKFKGFQGHIGAGEQIRRWRFCGESSHERGLVTSNYVVINK